MYIGIMNTQYICDIGLLLACTVQNFSFTHTSLLFVIIPEFCDLHVHVYTHKKKCYWVKYIHVMVIYICHDYYRLQKTHLNYA